MKNKVYDTRREYLLQKIAESEICSEDEKKDAAKKLKAMQDERNKNELKK